MFGGRTSLSPLERLIFEQAGVTAGAFYHYFESKKDLALAVIEERVAAEVEHTWMRPVREASTTLDGVVKAFKSIAAHLEEPHRFHFSDAQYRAVSAGAPRRRAV